MARKSSTTDWSQFIDAKFNGADPLTEETAEEIFDKFSALGLADMLIETEREGGFTETILLEHTPDEIRDLDDTDEFEKFWQWLIFMTKRYKWNPLPGMQQEASKKSGSNKKTRITLRKTPKDGTYKSRVIEGLGGEDKAASVLKKLLEEHGSLPKVMAVIQDKCDISDLTIGNFRVIKKNLCQ